MNFILRVIANSATLFVCQKAFPTFWGGFYTLMGLVILHIITRESPSLAEKK